jgi:hypothetical protein
MPKNKPRYLRLGLKSDTPGRVSDRKIIGVLMDSIRRGDYLYRNTRARKNWKVAIGWSNKPNAPLRWQEFTRAMTESAESSPGFDFAVAEYLRGQLE